MSSQRINKQLQKIQQAEKDGYLLEAFFLQYHLNIELLLLISSKYGHDQNVISKPKDIINYLIRENGKSFDAKSTISQKSLKLVKAWLEKTDPHIKSLRVQPMKGIKEHLHHAQKLFPILNISAFKLERGSKN